MLSYVLQTLVIFTNSSLSSIVLKDQVTHIYIASAYYKNKGAAGYHLFNDTEMADYYFESSNYAICHETKLEVCSNVKSAETVIAPSDSDKIALMIIL